MPRHELDNEFEFLDLFSTSQTFVEYPPSNVATCAAEKCIKNAPYFAYEKRPHTFGIVQGCCNSWNCPRCGIQRAKHEYGRLVQGCKELSKEHQLWFITVTCRGKEMSKNEADTNYGEWTNTLLTRWRTYNARKGKPWHYAQVTERQKRGHPHSHILTTFEPPDCRLGVLRKWETLSDGKRSYVEKQALRSDYVRRSVMGVGLGDQYDISRVESVEGASRYVAKYLFKDTIFNTKWPKGWRRVRYSQSFPQLPQRETNAFVLMKPEHWRRLGNAASVVICDEDMTKEWAWANLRHYNITIR